MQELLEMEEKTELDLNDLGPKDESQLYIDKIKHCDRKTQFYTGLPNWATFLALFQFLEPKNDIVVWRENKQAKDQSTW